MSPLVELLKQLGAAFTEMAAIADEFRKERDDTRAALEALRGEIVAANTKIAELVADQEADRKALAELLVEVNATLERLRGRRLAA
jgi:chromosome segregation ATPase